MNMSSDQFIQLRLHKADERGRTKVLRSDGADEGWIRWVDYGGEIGRRTT
jgi:hypothetical protein